jgi:hypothetical protein
MSYFGEFLYYVELYDSGRLWKDMTYKNYDLLWRHTDAKLRKALADCGFTADELSVALAECATRIRERGFHLGEGVIRRLLGEWYVWRRLESGEYRKWKYRSSDAAKRTSVAAQPA